MSEQPSSRRPVLAFRLSRAGIARLDERAKDEGVERSELIRRMLAYAAWKMPRGWKPQT